jgi:hypothetical protein
MSTSPSSSLGSVAVLAPVGTGTEQEINLTRLQSQRIAQCEQQGFEMGRAAMSFHGGMAVAAAAVVPVVDLPTTTSPICLYNANQGGGKLYHIKRVSAHYGSGTEGAAGFGLFGGIAPLPLATALVANGSNIKTQCSRGFGLCTGFIDVGKTIATGTAWMLLGGINTLAATVTGNGYTVDVSHLGFVVAPGFAFTWGVLADTGTTAKYVLSVAWDEVTADLA